MEASVLLIVIVIAVIVLLVKSDTGNIRYQQFLHAQELEELKALVERALAEMASMKAESPAANASPTPTTEESGAKAPETEPNQAFRLENGLSARPSRATSRKLPHQQLRLKWR